MDTQDAASRSQYLSFNLAGGDYAINILQVKEILQYETVTHVPSVPPSIRGVINLRGAVVPVIDLAVKFGLESTPITKRTCILVVETQVDGERTVVGVLADAVREVLELGRDEIVPPPSFGAQVRVGCLAGMGKASRGFVMLLDLNRVISAGEKEPAGQLGPEDDEPLRATAP